MFQTRPKQFAGKVREKREKLDMTQKDLGSKTGTSIRTVSKVETGCGNPRFETVLMYAKTLGFSLDAIVFGDDTPHDDVPYCVAEYFGGMCPGRAEQYIALCQQSDLLNEDEQKSRADND